MNDLQLSRAQSNVLNELVHRQQMFPLHDCWLVYSGYGRYALVVPTGDGLERRFAVNGRTVADLHGRGLITYGPDHLVPVYKFRASRDQSIACTVALTDAGMLAGKTIA